MQFRVLGSLEILGDDGPLPIGRGKRRKLLGLLLVDANQVIPADRLIDALWDGRPPPTAKSALQVLVSELRRTLASGRAEMLLTEAAGYVLKVEPDELDSTRFERLLDTGRTELAAGDSYAAQKKLTAALALWRGPPLQDFAYDDFARNEIARLGELRLEAEEELVEAELALGNGAELVPKLEGLIARSPHRERIRGQMMRALYQAERQTDALSAYQDARRILVHELGVEPGPTLQRLNQAILRHDASLEPSRLSHPPRPQRETRPRRNRLLLALVPLAAILALGVALVPAFRDGNGSKPTSLAVAPPRSVADIDAVTGRLIGAIPLARQPLATVPDPNGLVVGYGAIWVSDGGQQTVVRIDPKTREIVQTIGIGADVRGLAAGFGSIWVAGGDSATLSRIDPRTNRVIATIRLGHSHGVPNGAFAIAAGAGSVWTTAGADSVDRIDPHTNRIVTHIAIPAIGSLAAGDRSAWAGTNNGVIFRLEPRASRVGVTSFATLQPGELAGPMTAGGNALWVIVGSGTTLLEEYDPTTGRLASVIDAGRTNHSLVATQDDIWIADEDGGIIRVDARKRRVVGRITLGRSVTWIAAGEGAIWATVQT
jgi:DNA-binding SARP family transcriptional activator/streptogramin lyase